MSRTTRSPVTLCTAQRAARARGTLRRACYALMLLLSGSCTCCSRGRDGETAQGSSLGRYGELRVQKLVLVDASGKIRAVLGTDKENDMTRLDFLGEDNSLLATIAAGPAGRWIDVCDPNDGRALSLGVTESVGPALVLYGKKRQRRAGIILDKDGGVETAVFDEAGTKRYVLWLKSGETHLVLNDEARRPRIALSVAADGECAVTLYDAEAKRVGLELDAQGKPLIAVLGEDGEVIWGQLP